MTSLGHYDLYFQPLGRFVWWQYQAIPWTNVDLTHLGRDKMAGILQMI